MQVLQKQGRFFEKIIKKTSQKNKPKTSLLDFQAWLDLWLVFFRLVLALVGKRLFFEACSTAQCTENIRMIFSVFEN